MPPGVVTDIVPVVAPVRTVTVILVSLTMLNDIAAVPLNLTAEAFVKFVPVIVTAVPSAPLEGVKEVIVGAGTTV